MQAASRLYVHNKEASRHHVLGSSEELINKRVFSGDSSECSAAGGAAAAGPCAPAKRMQWLLFSSS